MNASEKTGVMSIGAAVVALGVGFGAKDWAAGAALFGALLYAIPLMHKLSR
jgi:hypothetical protein